MPRILVADDDPYNQHVTSRMLENAGVLVDIAADGRAAIDRAAERRFDLILMDVQMPVVDGLHATIEIRDAEQRAGDEPVPIVAFTAHADPGLRERCLQSGMNDYLQKPVEPHVLIDVVRKWIDTRPALLIADDSPEIRRLVRQALRDTYRIVDAVNGREALRQFDRQSIAFVLLDMNMPVLDGYATATQIRGRENGRDVPIVALTGNEGPDERARAEAAGCSLHVAKPVSLATLRATVDAALHARRGAVILPGEPPTALHDVRLEIDPLIADMVPAYVREKRQDVLELRRMVAMRAFDDVQRMAHGLKGTGAAFGVPDITRIGRALEDAALAGDPSSARALVEELDVLLARVEEQLGA